MISTRTEFAIDGKGQQHLTLVRVMRGLYEIPEVRRENTYRGGP